MSEEVNSNNPELVYLTMPSSLRIRQRLGQITTGKVFDDELIPQLEQLGGRELPVTDFLNTLIAQLTDYAKKHMLGAQALAYGYIPKIINELVDDASKEQVFDMWGVLIEEIVEKDQVEEDRIRKKYLQRDNKPSRKQKKVAFRSQQQSAKAYRLHQEQR